MQVYRCGGRHGEIVEADIFITVLGPAIKRKQKVCICCLTLTWSDDWSTVPCFPLTTAMRQYSTGLCVIVMMMHKELN